MDVTGSLFDGTRLKARHELIDLQLLVKQHARSRQRRGQNSRSWGRMLLACEPGSLVSFMTSWTFDGEY